jgi:hypothetical protein
MAAAWGGGCPPRPTCGGGASAGLLLAIELAAARPGALWVS